MLRMKARSLELSPPAWTILPRNLLALVVILAIAIMMHAWVRPAVGNYYNRVMMDVGINIVLAVSLTIVNGFTGQFSIGHAGFMTLGGYVAAATTYYGSQLLWSKAAFFGGTLSSNTAESVFSAGLLGGGDLLFVAGCVLGGCIAAGAGYVVGLPSLRLRGDYLAIVTLGFGEIIRVLLQASGPQVTRTADIAAKNPFELTTALGGALGFTRVPIYTTQFWTILFGGVTLLVAYRLKQSSMGRALLSIREDEVAAEAMGVKTTRMKVLAFVIAAFFAGMGGGLYAHQLGQINAGELGFMKSFDFVIMVVLGGMGSISGATLAAIVLTVLPELLRGVAEYRMIVYALLLIVMMLVRPQGLFGVREAWELIRPLTRRMFGSGAKA
ncbi:MAG: branched-chain amino acid ABC transporter permease [Phycisphaerales bacterium]|nr:branched-chain amino acid ABC transporter permease [Phycisphaerales bacterium]